MTLLEILMVLVIISSTLGLGLSFVQRRENSIKKTFRQWTALNRELDSKARLSNQIYRLVIDMEDKHKNTWWVEQKIEPSLAQGGQGFIAGGLQTITTESQQDDSIADDSRAGDSRADDSIADDFFMADQFFEEAQTLPGDLKFTGLEHSRKQKNVSDSKAYIYYFPEGQSQQVLIKLKSDKKHWSVWIDRFQGDLTVFTGDKTLADLQRE